MLIGSLQCKLNLVKVRLENNSEIAPEI